MKCPYCGQEMKLGRLHGESEHAVLWLPDHAEYPEWFLTKKKVEEHGGVVLDSVSGVGFFAKEKPESFWCSNCRIFITKLL